MKSQSHEKADPILYRTYYSLMLRDILFYLGYDSTRQNKRILHEWHKRVLGFKSIAGGKDETVKQFLFEVGVFWAERGIFIRTNRKQPINILELPLKDIWDKL